MNNPLLSDLVISPPSDILDIPDIPDIEYIMPYDLENTFHIICNGSNQSIYLTISDYTVEFTHLDNNEYYSNSTSNSSDINEIHLDNHIFAYINIPDYAFVKYIDDIIIIFRCTSHVYIHTNRMLHQIIPYSS